MTSLHAIVHIDHRAALVLQFDAEHVQAQKVKAHAHYARQYFLRHDRMAVAATTT